VNDIDLSHFNFQPIGTSDADYFRGIFDGQEYKIIGLEIQRLDQEQVGLFSVLMDSGVIKNLTLEGELVRGKGHFGALLGECAGIIVNCHSSAEIWGKDDAEATNMIGGLVGHNTATGIIRNCSTTMTGYYIDGNADEIGGLVGKNSGKIEWCYTECEWVNGVNKSDIGGIAGSNYGTIMECYSNSSVDGSHTIGGIVGLNYGSGRISDCYNVGSYVWGSNGTVGGLAGKVEGAIVERCYVSSEIDGYSYKEGALIGENISGTVSDSVWDNTRTGLPCCGHGTPCNNCFGKTPEEMKKRITYPSWDFTNVWTIEEGITYPYLRGIGDRLSPPTGVTASSDQTDGVHISWNTVIDAGVYRVYRSDSADEDAPKIALGDGW